ncbi:MAG: amino acid permease [Candidatus Eremiobacteraeota bacterium]|nr:amino acid permease [Candidatus Eremiobacteraeota bacterium]
MGGIIGTGIFVNPSVVATRAHTVPLILASWLAGGAIALLGGFVFAELAARRPRVGGLYAYMRDAFHPVVAFAYGWTALLVSQSGGMALAAITFALYFNPLGIMHVPAIVSAVAILSLFSFINCLGVREGGFTQNLFMVLKIAVILALIVAGTVVKPNAGAATMEASPAVGFGMLAMLGSALIPVLYAYDGWQTASFMSGELEQPRRTLAHGLVIGVLGVVALYLAVAIVSLRVLGPAQLAASSAPATDIMHVAGPAWEWVVAVGIDPSTLGFLSNQVLTSPRIYYAMAVDGDFFTALAWLHPKTRAPVVAIALQGVVAIVLTLSVAAFEALRAGYQSILDGVTAIDFTFFCLAALAVFVFRARDGQDGRGVGVEVPGHPYTTALFGLISAGVVLYSAVAFPRDALPCLVVLASGAPAYYLWRRYGRAA